VPKKTEVRIRGVYGGPWARLAGTEIPLSRETLNRLGQAIVDSIVKEAKKDLAKQGRSPTPKGQPEGLPSTGSFFDSFGFRIRGKKTVEITSKWPWIHQIRDGRPPYKMTWLTQQKGVYQVPMPQPDGTVLVRMAPLQTKDAWIHPGFARHTFLQRGVKKARDEMAKIIGEEAKAYLKRMSK